MSSTARLILVYVAVEMTTADASFRFGWMRLARLSPLQVDLLIAVALCLFVLQDVLLSDYLTASRLI